MCRNQQIEILEALFSCRQMIYANLLFVGFRAVLLFLFYTDGVLEYFAM